MILLSIASLALDQITPHFVFLDVSVGLIFAHTTNANSLSVPNNVSFSVIAPVTKVSSVLKLLLVESIFLVMLFLMKLCFPLNIYIPMLVLSFASKFFFLTLLFIIFMKGTNFIVTLICNLPVLLTLLSALFLRLCKVQDSKISQLAKI
jgi:hypothetical protein